MAEASPPCFIRFIPPTGNDLHGEVPRTQQFQPSRRACRVGDDLSPHHWCRLRGRAEFGAERSQHHAGFSQNRNQPIQIEAALLEMRDKKEATFSGNVKVVPGRHHHDV
jgi:lipopolysaccharide assembly outer membrane protein LptD (OstA)